MFLVSQTAHNFENAHNENLTLRMKEKEIK